MTVKKETKVKLPINGGEVHLRRPDAGPRNDALIEAEGPNGLKLTKFFVELLPNAIVSHPFPKEMVNGKEKPLKDILRKTEWEDYDAMVDGLKEIVPNPDQQEDDIKKSESSSEPKSSQETQESETKSSSGSSPQTSGSPPVK